MLSTGSLARSLHRSSYHSVISVFCGRGWPRRVSGVCREFVTVVVTSVVRLAREVGMTNMTDGSHENPSSTNHGAARAWLDRCSPEYRAVLEQALHADVDALGGGFLDSWQETREQTRAAVDAFTEAQKRQREDESIKRMVIPVSTEDVTSGREWTFICGHGQWVDPCPSWDEIRPHGVRPGTPRDERLRARYEAGRAEHREDWTKWSVEYVTRMIQEEDDDGVIYRAMRKYIMGKLGLL